MPDSEGEGAVHMLAVRELGDPSGIYGLRPIEDYEIQHPWCCQQEERSGLLGKGVMYLAWTCDIGCMENDGDLAFSLKCSGTEVTEPGMYLIQGWWRKSYIWDAGAYEYDNGIGVVGRPPGLAANCQYLAVERGETTQTLSEESA